MKPLKPLSAKSTAAVEMSQPKRDISPAGWVVTGAFLFLVGWFYVWTATQGLPIPWGEKQGGLYNHLTHAFMAGQLSLLEKPDPGLIALEDPYDPGQNSLYRARGMHDASLYDGKYYLYFGPTPVFLLFLPFRLLSLGDLNPGLAVALFFFGGLCAALALFRVLLRSFRLQPSFGVWLLSLGTLALTTAIPFTLRRPLHYEVAISCGYFCLMLSLWFFFSWKPEIPNGFWRLAMGSLFLGLAVGARPNWLLASPVLFLVSYLICANNDSTRRGKLGLSGAVWLPFLLILFLLGLYNDLRFDSWAEFGLTYQLASFHPQKVGQFSAPSLLAGLYFYLWQPLQFDWVFPFFHALPRYPGTLPAGYVTLDPVAGLLAIAPLAYILFLSFALHPRKIRSAPSSSSSSLSPSVVPRLIIFYVALTAALQVILLSLKPGATMRYVVDIGPLFLLASLLVWCSLIDKYKQRPALKFFITFGGTLAILYGSLANVAISFTGYFDSFRYHNPAAYDDLKRTIQTPVLWAASPFIKANQIVIEVHNPNGLEKEGIEPFFWLGEGEVQIDIYSKNDGFASLRASMFPGPSLPDTQQRRLRVKTDGGYEIEEVFASAGPQVILLAVRKGINHIYLKSLDRPTQVMTRERPALILRVQNLRVEECISPAILQIHNPNGIEATREGVPFFWLGTEEAILKIFTLQKGALLLRGHFSPGPSLPDTKTRRLRIKTGRNFEEQKIFLAGGEKNILVPVEEGVNLISLKSLDQPTFRLANDSRTLLLMVRDLRIIEPRDQKAEGSQ